MAEGYELTTLKTVILAGIIIFTAYALQPYRRRSKFKFPAGPKGIPFVGNLLQLPAQNPGPVATEWADKYGDFTYTRMGRLNWVFINTSRVMHDLYEKRSKKYSSRPRFLVAQDGFSHGNRVLLMQYGERWREIRKLMHQLLATSGSNAVFAPYQDLESRQMLYEYFTQPDLFYNHNARYANSVIMSVVFGVRVKQGDPTQVALFETADKFMESILIPRLAVPMMFPFLAKLPNALKWWHVEAENEFKKTLGVYETMLKQLEARVKAHEQKPCFATSFFEHCKTDAWKYDNVQKLFVLGSVMEAGSDTTRNQINVFLAAVAAYPEFAHTARAELDKVCGDAQRLPSFKDWEALPYMRACVKENLRWRQNMAEIAMPHGLSEDDTYEGYHFPAGTVFQANTWKICTSELEYDDPLAFRPERFLDDDLNDMLKGHPAFGLGRRQCVGWNVGCRSMFLSFARLLYCFNFEQDPAHPIDTMHIDAFSLRNPYNDAKLKIAPRSAKHVELIKRECKSATQEKYATI